MEKSTLEEIGGVFGVSAMSVSNALNGRKGISPQKAEAIRAYAESIGFRPAYMARSLGSRRTRMIGICMRANLGDPWAGELMHHLQNELRRHRFHVNIILADDGPESETWALNFFNELRVDGVIIGPLLLHQYRTICGAFRGLPYVMSFGATAPLPIDHVKLDEFDGARMAVDYLVERGIRRIGHIGIRLERPLDNVSEKFSRQAGFCDTVRRHGLPLRKEWILDADTEEEGVIENVLDNFLSSGAERPEAWFFQSDTLAARCYKVFFKHKLRIPEDVSIIGFDNNPLGRVVYPALSTIGFDSAEYARFIAEILLDGITTGANASAGNSTPLRSRILSPVLIERDSVR